MFEIDGSTLEGGGQILRTAGALSCILGKPFSISNIRANRPKPGLQAQHLTGILALARACNAKTTGAELHSTSLTFSPGPIQAGNHSFDIGTAGSTTLIAQTLLPVLSFAPSPSHISIMGGTHVPFAPTFDYFANVFLPTASRLGLRASAKLIKPGWYPKGGGKMELTVEPINRLDSCQFEKRGELKVVNGISFCSNLPTSVAQRQAATAKAKFPAASISTTVAPADCPGSAITLWAEFENCPVLGASALGKLGKPAEAVGEEAALALEREISSGAAVDMHLADQLMLYTALAEGKSTIRPSQLTQHARTNAWLIERFTGKRILIDAGSNILCIDGIGFKTSARQ